MGPNADPWGTPLVTGHQLDLTLFIFALCGLLCSFSKELKISRVQSVELKRLRKRRAEVGQISDKSALSTCFRGGTYCVMNQERKTK